MSLKNFLLKEKQKLKGKAFREKWEYFRDYYAATVIAAVLVIVFVVSIVVSMFSGKETALSGVLLNSYPTDKDAVLFTDYPQHAQIDINEFDLYFNTNYYLFNDGDTNDIYTMQYLSAGIAAGDIDFITAPLEIFEPLCYQSGFFADLREHLSSDVLKELSDRLYYADNSIITALQEPEAIVGDIEIPDPKRPEDMKDPIPIGIDLRGCEEINSIYPSVDSPIYFGISCTAQNHENILKFIHYLLDP